MHEAVNTQTATVAIVPVIGEHDLSGYEPLKAVLARAAIQAPNVIVDLSHCDFIDGRRCDRIAARCTQRRRFATRVASVWRGRRSQTPSPASLVHLSQRIPSYASATDALADGQRHDSIVIHLKRPTAVEA
jgi:hypothetical protein